MRRSIILLAIVGMLVAALAIPAFAGGDRSTGRGTGPTVYVEGRGFYDSIVVKEGLTWNGQNNWQLLETGGPGPQGLHTEFGPGDVGYVGGRWFMEGDLIEGPSAGDTFFICPLLGPARPTA